MFWPYFQSLHGVKGKLGGKEQTEELVVELLLG